jgi:hypothetical protein
MIPTTARHRAGEHRLRRQLEVVERCGVDD